MLKKAASQKDYSTDAGTKETSCGGAFLTWRGVGDAIFAKETGVG